MWEACCWVLGSLVWVAMVAMVKLVAVGQPLLEGLEGVVWVAMVDIVVLCHHYHCLRWWPDHQWLRSVLLLLRHRRSCCAEV